MSDEDREKLRKIETELRRRTTNRFLFLWMVGLFVFPYALKNYFIDDVGLALFIGGLVAVLFAYLISKNI